MLTKTPSKLRGSGRPLFAVDHKKSAKDIWRARSLLNRLSTYDANHSTFCRVYVSTP